MNSIKTIDLTSTDLTSFAKSFVGCLVLTDNNKILLQQRGNDWDRFPGCLATFGGQIELGETPMQALVRELKEELGAIVSPSEAINLGTISENYTNYNDLIYTYFWRDQKNTITGCYEGEPKFFNSYSDVIMYPNVLDDVVWILNECLDRRLIQ